MDEKTLKQLENIINKALANLVTKEDAKNLATRDDLKKFATRDDLKKFATRDDLKKFATRDDLKKFATKDELFERFDKLDKMQMAIIESTDEAKEDKIAVTKLEQRVERLEEKVFV